MQTKIVLIGHSMGGIVIKKVCAFQMFSHLSLIQYRHICWLERMSLSEASQPESTPYTSSQHLTEDQTTQKLLQTFSPYRMVKKPLSLNSVETQQLLHLSMTVSDTMPMNFSFGLFMRRTQPDFLGSRRLLLMSLLRLSDSRMKVVGR